MFDFDNFVAPSSRWMDILSICSDWPRLVVPLQHAWVGWKLWLLWNVALASCCVVGDWDVKLCCMTFGAWLELWSNDPWKTCLDDSSRWFWAVEVVFLATEEIWNVGTADLLNIIDWKYSEHIAYRLHRNHECSTRIRLKQIQNWAWESQLSREFNIQYTLVPCTPTSFVATACLDESWEWTCFLATQNCEGPRDLSLRYIPLLHAQKLQTIKSNIVVL